MDSEKFGALTRTLARTGSRRTVLRGLIAGIAGGGMAVVGLDQASASTCCTGIGATAPRSKGGNATACCSDPSVCYKRDGRALKCGTRYRAEGGKAGCCDPLNAACISNITTYPALPAGCVIYVP